MTKRILFIAEDITLAQIVRLKVLADSLDPTLFEVHFASSNNKKDIVGEFCYTHWPINIVDAKIVEKAVYDCTRIYEEEILQEYIQEDLELFRKVTPDIIIGDFRLSLPISAKIAGIPFAVLINAYWSPYVRRENFPMPDHPMESVLGYKRMKYFYPFIRPYAFQYFAKPINNLRKKYKLPVLGSLQDLLTYGDYVLYPDTPFISPVEKLPNHHYYLGPVLWSPKVSITEQLKVAMKKPYIYCTLGSSGRTNRVQELLKALGMLPFNVILATAEKFNHPVPLNVIQISYAPGEEVAKNALLVISNGGSTTSYQALSQGKPVLGIASNLDQYLSMENLENAGVGKHLRGGSFVAEDVYKDVISLIEDKSFKQGAEAIQDNFNNYNSNESFAKFLSSVL